VNERTQHLVDPEERRERLGAVRIILGEALEPPPQLGPVRLEHPVFAHRDPALVCDTFQGKAQRAVQLRHTAAAVASAARPNH
jgi:hypothetical protein